MERIEDYLKALEDAEKTPNTKEFTFDIISKKISLLKMFCEVINNHPEELEEYYRNALNKWGFEPCENLKDYIILEIATFYETASIKFNGIILPPSHKVIIRFRHNIIAHMQRGTNAEIVKEYKIINEVGFHKIYEEYIKFRDELFQKIKNN